MMAEWKGQTLGSSSERPPLPRNQPPHLVASCWVPFDCICSLLLGGEVYSDVSCKSYWTLSSLVLGICPLAPATPAPLLQSLHGREVVRKSLRVGLGLLAQGSLVGGMCTPIYERLLGDSAEGPPLGPYLELKYKYFPTQHL